MRLFLAGVSYDAYCSMIAYIRESELWNPYDHRDVIIRSIATYYSFQKEKGKSGKACLKKPPKRRIVASNTDTRTPSEFFARKENSFDKNVPIWDLTITELQEAYKTTAMKRYLDWYTEKTLEKTYCLPFFKIKKKVGNFPRRITWLYVDDGNDSSIHDLQ